MSNKKKIIVMSALVLLLAVTAVFNFVLSSSPTADAELTAGNYFTTYRTERTASRNEELVQLDSVISLYEKGDTRYSEATKMKLDIVNAMEKELIVENMVKSLGFSDAVVTVSADSDNVNVFINTDELNYDTALSIYSMLKEETDIPATNIRIVPVYAES